MFTVAMEVKSKTSHNIDFYIPSTKEFKKYPKSEKGISKAITELCKNLENDWITDFRILVYEGKFNHWNKETKPFIVYDKNLSLITEANK